MRAEESETPSRAALRTAYLRRRWRVLFANLQRDIRSSEVTQIIACAVIGAVVGAVTNYLRLLVDLSHKLIFNLPKHVTLSMGSGTDAWASASAAATRSPKSLPRCPMRSNPAGSQSPLAAPNTSTRRATGAAITAPSVSRSSAWSSDAGDWTSVMTWTARVSLASSACLGRAEPNWVSMTAKITN